MKIDWERDGKKITLEEYQKELKKEFIYQIDVSLIGCQIFSYTPRKDLEIKNAIVDREVIERLQSLNDHEPMEHFRD